MIIYGGPQGAPPVVDPPRPPVVIGPVFTAPLSWLWKSWTGEDEWELTNPASPVVKLKGATGIGQTDPEHWWADSPTMDGSTWDGMRVGRGQVFLPLMVQGDDSDDFLAQHERFMRSLDPRREGVIRVTRHDGRWREAVCRYESGADLVMDYDPVAGRRATYGITWAMGDPYWHGEPIEHMFTVDSGAAGLFPGPPFRLARDATLSNSKTTNPGDVASYPVWRVNGPFTSFTVGVEGMNLSMTLTKAAGQWVEIDMNPRKLTVVDEAGTDRWPNLTAAEFEGIPPGVEVDVMTGVSGQGPESSVSLKFTPRYRRAW